MLKPHQLNRYRTFQKSLAEMAEIYSVSEESVWIALDLLLSPSRLYMGEIRSFLELLDWVELDKFIAHRKETGDWGLGTGK